MQKILTIGVIVKPQGIQGMVKVHPQTDRPERFLELGSVLLCMEDRYVRRKVLDCRVLPNGVFLRLEGCEDRNAAERLRGVALCVERSEAVALPDHNYFIADLIGCHVLDDSGTSIGVLEDVLQHGAADVYVLDNGDMFPAIRRVILAIDVEQGVIKVDRKALLQVIVHAD